MKLRTLFIKNSYKLETGDKELAESDIVEIPKGLRPGEWIFIESGHKHGLWIGYINQHATSYYKIKIIKKISDKTIFEKLTEEELAQKIIITEIENAVSKRQLYKKYHVGCRLVFGASDNLPGLIVDKYEKYIFVQINTAGLDRFREIIKNYFINKYLDHTVLMFDNEEYRKAEVLPLYPQDKLTQDLEVSEGNLKYKISPKVVQKIGYYYDHRENRERLCALLNSLDHKYTNGLDLFSYVGSWGLHLLNSGVNHVEFVDQGDMENEIETNLKINNFASKGKFIRSDVFKFLDRCIANKVYYDVIVSDPPAFTKNEKNKSSALLGYQKLHQKAMSVLNDGGLFVAASCTHHVTHEELDKTVQSAALKNNQKIQLLDMGMQGLDHPVTGLLDKGFYIKYLVYLTQKGEI